MRCVAILIAGSRNVAFYSQIAAIAAAVGELPWRRWRPSIHAFLGGTEARHGEEWSRWAPFLRGVQVTDVTAESFSARENWAQVDAALEMAPRDADVLLSLDADTLPVAGLEDVLDAVADGDLVAGVMAHFPPPPAADPRGDWMRAANGIINTPLTFGHVYSLVEPWAPDERRLAPFYVNGGVMFFGRSSFDRFVPRYLGIRATLQRRAIADAFVGQIASTLTVTDEGLKTSALPMRYNFPNDPVAERLHPLEAANVVIYHYLRTGPFDRQKIFATAQAFEDFLELSLNGPDRGFQSAVRRILGARYPF